MKKNSELRNITKNYNQKLTEILQKELERKFKSKFRNKIKTLFTKGLINSIFVQIPLETLIKEIKLAKKTNKLLD